MVDSNWFKYDVYKKGIYADGHDRADVVKYRAFYCGREVNERDMTIRANDTASGTRFDIKPGKVQLIRLAYNNA